MVQIISLFSFLAQGPSSTKRFTSALCGGTYVGLCWEHRGASIGLALWENHINMN